MAKKAKSRSTRKSTKKTAPKRARKPAKSARRGGKAVKRTTKRATKKMTKKTTTRRSTKAKSRSTRKKPARKTSAKKKATKKTTKPARRGGSSTAKKSGRRVRAKKDDTVLMDMLLGSAARARILRLIFREPTVSFAHKEIAKMTGVALPKVRREAKALAEMDIVTNRSSGGQMRVKVNTAFPFVEELKRMATASFPVGRDSLVKMLKPAGNVKLIIVAGTLMNDPKGRVDLLVVADRYSEKRLARAVKKVEQAAAAELRWAGMPTKEFTYRWKMFDRFLHDMVSGPHEKLVEKVKVKK